MRGREMAVAVLDQMQMLDQQIAPARARAEQRADLVERRRIDLAALRGAARPAAAVAVGASPVGLPPFALGFERVVVLIRAFPSALDADFDPRGSIPSSRYND